MSDLCKVTLKNRKGDIFISFYINGDREEVRSIISNAKYQKYLIVNQDEISDLMISNNLLENSVIEIKEIQKDKGYN